MARNSTKIKDAREDQVFNFFTNLILFCALIIVLYPLYFILIASISDPYMVLRGEVVFFPKGINFDSYEKLLDYKSIWTGYWNSIVYMVVGTACNVVLTVTLAYSLSRNYFCFRKPIMIIVMITMYFSGGMIPTYLLVQNLGLRNSMWALIFVGIISPYNVIIARTFFESTIPRDLEEAAEIDGCSKIRFFMSFALPLSKAIIAVLILYYAMGHWNDYMKGLLYLDKPDMYPLQLVLRGILIETQAISSNTDAADVESIEQAMKLAEALKYATIVVSVLPPLMIYPFVQKYFVKGVMIGSVKG
ncbi:MAG: carbohydrate ABC transporter permease [Eubacteriales bacterium]